MAFWFNISGLNMRIHLLGCYYIFQALMSARYTCFFLGRVFKVDRNNGKRQCLFVVMVCEMDPEILREDGLNNR
jgi:hypothetical protein